MIDQRARRLEQRRGVARRGFAGAERSFRRPLFLAAVAVLAVNDHWLKHAGVLPGEITGKLSDVAGLLAAPLVLAWLTRARTERAWLACHVAVGCGFAALQWAPAAEAIESMAAAGGLTVRVWPDASDLFALPALALSHHAFGHGDASRPPADRWRALAVGAASLLVCAATSATNSAPAPRYPYPPAGVLDADVYVRHVASTQVVSVSALRESSTVDCADLLEAPEEALTAESFNEPREWLLERGDALPLWERRGGAADRGCYAVALSVEGRTWWLAWRHGEPPVHEIPIQRAAERGAEPEAIRLNEDHDVPPRVPDGVRVRPAPR